MLEVTVVFKSGAKHTFIANKVTWEASRIAKSFEWSAVAGKPKPLHIDLDEVAAIFTHEIADGTEQGG